MRYDDLRLLIIPTLLFLFFLGADSQAARWHGLLSGEMHALLRTLVWVAGGWLFTRLLGTFVWRRRQTHLSGAAPMLLQHTVTLIVWILASAGIAQTVFHQPLTAFWATSGIVGIVLGIALRGIIADFFSGIALELDPPFKIGDYIEIRMGGEPVLGRVTQVNWRATQVVPRDSTNTIHVPNSLLSSIAVNNVYRPLGKTRFELLVSFGPEIPHERVHRVLMSAARSTDGIDHRELPPEVVATRYNTSGVEYMVRYWLAPEVSPTGTRNTLLNSIMDLARRSDLHVAFPREEITFERKQEAVRDPLAIKTGVLERNSFFKTCRPEELKAIAAHMHTRIYPGQARVVGMGDAGDSMFLVSEGMLEVSVPNGSEHNPLVVGKLVAGDFFGEMSLLADEPRAATVTSVTDTVLYEIRRQHIKKLVENRPEIADGMTDVATARRLKNENAGAALHAGQGSEEHRNLKSIVLEKMHSLLALLRD